MIHEMKLNTSPFEKVSLGEKTVELRLYDEKRRKIDIGDKIIFSNIEDPMRKIAVVVKSIHRYASFEELYEDIPLEKCGINGVRSSQDGAAEMSKYYSDDEVRRYGVVGIEIKLTDIDTVIKEQEEQRDGV